jgi:hypothetical protein
MRPDGPFLREWLNQGRGRDHGPDLRPRRQRPGGPTLGVYDGNGAGCFPIAEPLVLAEGVHHNGFFASAAARDKLLEWLPG